MANKVQVGQVFENIQSGVEYRVFSITGASTNAIPVPAGDELLHLVMKGRPNMFVRADVFVTIPARNVLEFFVPIVTKA